MRKPSKARGAAFNGGRGSGGSGGSGGTAGSGGTGGASTATVSGIVYAATEGDSIALAGATVAIPGTSFSTTRGPDGSSSIEAPVGTTTILATAPGHWDDLQADVVPAGGGSGVELEVIPDPLVGQVAGGGGEVIFANVDVTTNVMPTATNASDEDCSFEFPDAIYPSQAKVFTEVAMVCP